MITKLKKQATGFTQVNNAVLNDKALSLKAKGLFAYLYSKPDNWQFSHKRIALEMKESSNTVANILRELEVLGYLNRERLPTGRMEYYIKYKPHTNNCDEAKPHTKKAKVAKSQGGKVGTVSNTDVSSNIKVNTSKQSLQKKQINDVIELFKEVNPSYEILFGNKTQRSACQRLLNKWSVPQIKAIVHGVLPNLNADTYAKGKSIDPYMMEKNLGFIKAYIGDAKSKTSRVVKI